MNNNHDFHKNIIMDNVFNYTSSLFPLSIILTNETLQGDNVDSGICEYSGIHLADTSLILSLKSWNCWTLNMAFDVDGKQLNSPLHKDCAFTFKSKEIFLWCKDVIDGRQSAFEHCDKPFIYLDRQFDDFKRIAMKFPAFEILLNGLPNKPIKSLASLIAELDSQLLKVRRQLF